MLVAHKHGRWSGSDGDSQWFQHQTWQLSPIVFPEVGHDQKYSCWSFLSWMFSLTKPLKCDLSMKPPLTTNVDATVGLRLSPRAQGFHIQSVSILALVECTSLMCRVHPQSSLMFSWREHLLRARIQFNSLIDAWSFSLLCGTLKIGIWRMSAISFATPITKWSQVKPNKHVPISNFGLNWQKLSMSKQTTTNKIQRHGL